MDFAYYSAMIRAKVKSIASVAIINNNKRPRKEQVVDLSFAVRRMRVSPSLVNIARWIVADHQIKGMEHFI